MKYILLVCDQTDIDLPLRRCLAHLVKSCQIEVVASAHQALDELHNKSFDLIIIDSHITDLDSLELIETVHYIDPELPTILMVNADHLSLWDAATLINTQPILRPFKPIAFLRLIDKLLHQHLERYRNLAQTLNQTLAQLTHQKQIRYALLVGQTGQVLVSTGSISEPVAEIVASLMIAEIANAENEISPERQTYIDAILAQEPEQNNLGLHILWVTKTLFLAVGDIPSAFEEKNDTDWSYLNFAVQAVTRAFQTHAPANTPESETTPEERDLTLSNQHVYISLERRHSPQTMSFEEYQPEFSTQINWDFLANTTQAASPIVNLTDRLQAYCQTE